MNLGRLAVTFVIALTGGWIGLRLRIPAGAMIGSLVAVAVYNYFSQAGYLPSNLKLVGQILLGGTVGMNFDKQSIAEIRKVIVPAMISVGILLILGVILGLILYKTTGLDLMTALLSTAPGGVNDMTILAGSYGADSIIVASIHLVRIISVIVVMPIVLKVVTWFLAR